MMENLDHLLKIVVGSRFGMHPSQHLDSIRQEKQKRAEDLDTVLRLRKTDRILEIGAGCGWTAMTLAPRVSKYFASDISQEFLDFALKELEGLPAVELIHLPYGDFDPVLNLKINVALALDVFTQFSFYDYLVYLKSVYQLLEPNGIFYFNFMNAQFLDIKSDQKLLRHESLFLKDRAKEAFLLHWMEPTTIERMGENIGFKIIDRHLSPDHSWYLFRKEVVP